MADIKSESPAGLRRNSHLVLDVDVCPGDEHASKHSAPSLWALLDRLPRDLWPALLRGDCGFGNEGIMREAEARGLAFLFKLRLTANVKRMIEKLAGARQWVCAGQGFEAKESAVRLTGWSRSRRVIVLRRRVKGALGLSPIDQAGAPQLSFAEIGAATEVYEYSVLVTSLDEDTEAFGQLYRDRGDGENIFDEMKNQWGWGGFTTHDLARCRLAARLLALFYDWWTIFVRLVDPSLHREAITSRPIRRCVYRKQLDLDTLVCTRGPNFPLSRLELRLMCPACGSRDVTVVFEPPTNREVRSG